jgi:predicted RNase H-like nuclease (RuvC/YqgF family)
MKIDAETFDFQMRLIRAEMKVESLTEQNQMLVGRCESNDNHIKYLRDRCEEAEVEIRSLKAYIKRFISPQELGGEA